MLKTILSIQNNGCEKIHCTSYGEAISVNAYSTATKSVNAANSLVIISELETKYPEFVVTNLGDIDDQTEQEFDPYLLHNLTAETDPAATDDRTAGYLNGSVWINTAGSPVQKIFMCVDPTEDAAVWKSLTPDEVYVVAEKTPVNAVAASGTITSDGTAPSDGDTVTIDEKVYTFKTTLTPTEGQVLIGGSAAAALDNLKSAINHEGTPDTDYKCEAVHPTVTATTNTNTTQLVVAKTAGSAENAIVTTKTSSHLSWGGATLSGGIDGTTGYANETCADASYLYHAIAANTVSGSNWRRISLGSAF